MSQTPLAAQVSVFQGSKNATPVETVPLSTVLQRIQDGTYRPFVEQLRQLLATAGKAWYDDAKKRSMAFTPGGVFTRRANAQLSTPSGLVHYDFDHPPNLADAKALLMQDPWIVYAFISPSGDGLKVAVRADGIVDDATYKHAWRTVLDYLQRTSPDLAVANDKACKDISRLCYTSWDPDLYVNPTALLYAVPRYQPPAPKPKPKPPSTSAPVATAPPSPSAPLPADRRQRYAQQTIETAIRMIDASIPPTATSAGTRHETRLKAARLLGGYVAGGIMTYDEAHAALEAAVARNTDHMARSMQTIVDGLAYGQQATITFEDLEQERQAWLQAQSATMIINGRPLAPPTRNGTSLASAAPQQTTTAAVPNFTGNGSGQTYIWGTPGQQVPAPRPDIIIGPDITHIVNEAQVALRTLPAAPVIYQRARRLCVIARGVKPPKWLHRPQDMPVILEASPAHLWELAGQAAKWWKLDKRAKQYELALPPKWFVEALQGRDGWPFPVLEGIVYSPTLRPDGSLLDTPGYDLDTGLYFDHNGTNYPPIPDNPDIFDTQKALNTLKDVLCDFPWAHDYDRSAALAAILSVVCRYTVIGNVPLFGISATTRGSGKGLLADVIALIGTGRHAPLWSQAEDDAEERKRLLALGMDGDPLVCIDNVTRPLGNSPLDLALTGSTFKDRILGTQTSKEVPMHAIFLATGNNLQYVGDLARRVVPIALDPKMEKPEERTGFRHPDLLAHVAQERPRLVIAALTILKAYFADGCPSQGLSAYGSFQPWSDLVRSALVWAGEEDPCAGRKTIEAQDPGYEALAGLLDAWHACYPTGAKITLKRLKQDITIYKNSSTPPAPNEWDDLEHAVFEFDQGSARAKAIDTRTLGNTLKHIQGRVIDQKRFMPAGTSKRAVEWKVEDI